ncbi:hypothetical protein G7046_g3548 [Stylonectria norvegica]|nr:hypothetical protein G7046_g3548 [Stylonectria norvegica]
MTYFLPVTGVSGFNSPSPLKVGEAIGTQLKFRRRTDQSHAARNHNLKPPSQNSNTSPSRVSHLSLKMPVEEITKDMADGLTLSSTPSSPSHSKTNTTPNEALKPDLPPSHVGANGKTVDEVWQDLKQSPLFMTDLEDNDDIAALQALAYEGTPLENGVDFKDRGNECFQTKAYADAKEPRI